MLKLVKKKSDSCFTKTKIVRRNLAFFDGKYFFGLLYPTCNHHYFFATISRFFKFQNFINLSKKQKVFK